MAENSLLYESEAEEQSQDVDHDALIRNMERELSALTAEFHVPGNKLRNLLEVIKISFEMSEKRRVELENMSERNRELEGAYNTEREKWKALQKKKIELEHMYEDERAKLEAEKRSLEISNVALESKIKQMKRQILELEHDVETMANKVEQDEKTRQELLERYKREFEVQSSIFRSRRSVMMESLNIHQRQTATLQPLQLQTSMVNPRVQDIKAREADAGGQVSLEPSILQSGITEQNIQDSIISLMVPKRKGTSAPSLEDEIAGISSITSIDPSASLMQWSWLPGVQPAETVVDPIEQYIDLDPEIVAAERVEAEMIRKENDAWKEEKMQLLKEKQAVREEKDALESNLLQLKLQIEHLEESKTKLMQELQEVKYERDELLDSEQNDKQITSKELYDLLEKHHKTREELERVRESNLRLQRLLNKPSWFTRMIEMINRVLEVPKEEKKKASSKLQQQNIANAQNPSLSASNGACIQNLTSLNGWLVEKGSPLPVEQLPTWIEHIPLKSIKIDRIDSVSIGRICLLATPPPHHTKSTRTTVNLPRWCAEIWVAVSDGELLFIEVIDILCKFRTERTHCIFRVHDAKHIQCMKCIPGKVEPSAVQRKTILATSLSFDKSDLVSSGEGIPMVENAHLMWIITEDNKLCFYPISGNRHQLVNSTQLTSKTFCLLHVESNVLVGQTASKIVVYSRSRDDVWNVCVPSREILLHGLGHDTSNHDVRCMAVVGHKVWVGCGPYIHVLNAEDFTIEKIVSIGQSDKTPQDIISMSSYAIVSMLKGSCLFWYDADSVTLLRTFDVAPMSFIYGNATQMTIPVDIKSIATDGENIYVGTSHGTMVVILSNQLKFPQPIASNSADSFLKQSSMPIHSHVDKIKNVLNIPLGVEVQGIKPPYRSLIASFGKGYTKHSEFFDEVAASGIHQQSEDFQVIVWGYNK